MLKDLIHNGKHFLITLRVSILTIFVSLFVITTGTIIIVRTVSFSNAISYTSLELMQYASSEVIRELDAVIKPAEIQANFTATLMQQGVLTDDEATLRPYIRYLANTLPLVRNVFWGDEQGDFVYAEKAADGSITNHVYNRSITPATHTIIYRDVQGHVLNSVVTHELNFDPRTRPWYQQAKNAHKTIWTDLYFFAPTPQYGITVAAPVYDPSGKFIGVFGLDVTLDYLSQFLSQHAIGEQGYAFVISEKGDVIAFPDQAPFRGVIPNHHKAYNLQKYPVPIVSQSLVRYQKTHRDHMILPYAGEKYLITYKNVPQLAQYGWLVGTVVPQSEFISRLQRINLITIAISSSVLLLGILLVSGLVTRVVRPMNALIKETERIKEFNLAGKFEIHTHIKEIYILSRAMNSMKHGLRHFQRYVPRGLVRQLIEAGEDVKTGGTRKHLTIFFSDIENFTTIAERVEANELMTQMCEYFEALTQIIIEEKGTIDKYMGDSIMAFWGAPFEVEDPCIHTARAALRCQAKLVELNAQWQQAGKHVLNTRIGIHRGEAIVGNVGSTERLNYTAIGDVVNIARRLEELNKTYQTKVIVSDVVYDSIKDYFALKLLDRVTIKGRAGEISIYELQAELSTHKNS